MPNIFLFILWPILIGGMYGSHLIGKKFIGKEGSIYLPFMFLSIFLIILMFIFGNLFPAILFVTYFYQ